MIENKQFLLNYFYEEFIGTEWLLQKDSVYADNYSNLLTTIEQSEAADEDIFWELEAQMQSLKSIYFERAKDPSAWVAPKKKAAVHKAPEKKASEKQVTASEPKKKSWNPFSKK